jgi:hypothetical protein
MEPEIIANLVDRITEIDHKEGVSPDDWSRVHPNLLILADELISFCDNRNLPLKFTSIIRPKIKGVSKTDIHADGRAFDISLIGWSDAEARDCAYTFNRKFKIGAISASSGEENEVIFEDGIAAGRGRHLHFQVRR